MKLIENFVQKFKSHFSEKNKDSIELILGQRITLDKLLISKKVKLKVTLSFSNVLEDYNLYLIALDKNEKAISDKYIISKEQLCTPDNSIRRDTNKNEFEIYIDLLPNYIEKINMLLTINKDGDFKNITNGYIKIFNENKEVANFKFSGGKYDNQKSLLLLQIYKKDEKWKIAIICGAFKEVLYEFNKNNVLKDKDETFIDIKFNNDIKNIDYQKIEATELIKCLKEHEDKYINIYPKINESIEHKIKFNNEFYGISSNYYFSPNFKLSDVIVKNISQKYINEYSKECYQYKITNIDVDYKKSNIDDDMLAFYYDGNESIVIKKEKLYFVKDNIEYFFKDIEIKDNRIVNKESLLNISQNTVQKGFIDFFNELKILNKKINLDKMIYQSKVGLNNKDYLKILIYMCCFKKELLANQILFLEERARQLRISSGYLLKLIDSTINANEDIYLEKLDEIHKHFNGEYIKYLLVDLAYLDKLGKNENKDSHEFTKFIEEKFQVKDLLIEELESNIKEMEREE